MVEDDPDRGEHRFPTFHRRWGTWRLAALLRGHILCFCNIGLCLKSATGELIASGAWPIGQSLCSRVMRQSLCFEGMACPL